MLIEAPLSRLSRRRGGDLGGGFLLGASLGLVFVPCAGPVLATVTVLAAQHRVGVDTVFLTLFYALGRRHGAAAGCDRRQRVSRRLRASTRWFRPVLGLVMAAFRVRDRVQPRPDVADRPGLVYERASAPHGAVQLRVASARAAPRGGGTPSKGRAHEAGGCQSSRHRNRPRLPRDRGLAQYDAEQTRLATPSARATSCWSISGLTLCIQLPAHAAAPTRLVHPPIIGTASRSSACTRRKFAFEHVLSNVSDAVRRLGVTWPVALDNNYFDLERRTRTSTGPPTTSSTRPDRFGAFTSAKATTRKRGRYPGLLGISGAAASIPDVTPTGRPRRRPISARSDRSRSLRRLAGRQGEGGRVQARHHGAAGLDLFRRHWALFGQTARAGAGARLKLHFQARDVYIVARGRGRSHDACWKRSGRSARSGVKSDRLYTVLQSSKPRERTARVALLAGRRGLQASPSG